MYICKVNLTTYLALCVGIFLNNIELRAVSVLYTIQLCFLC